MALDDLPESIRTAAHAAANGEVSWQLSDAPAAITALADAGHLILGMDTQTRDDDGGVMEVPFADLSRTTLTVEQARDEALVMLRDYGGEDGEWVLVTWR